MIFTIQNHKEVKNDVLEAKNWYKNQQNGLEKKFAFEIKRTINYIIKNPLLFQIKYKNARTAYTEIFPYGVHYVFDEKTKSITIIGVFHTSISPTKWTERLL